MQAPRSSGGTRLRIVAASHGFAGAARRHQAERERFCATQHVVEARAGSSLVQPQARVLKHAERDCEVGPLSVLVALRLASRAWLESLPQLVERRLRYAHPRAPLAPRQPRRYMYVHARAPSVFKAHGGRTWSGSAAQVSCSSCQRISGAFSSVSGGQRPDLSATSQVRAIWLGTAELAVVAGERISGRRRGHAAAGGERALNSSRRLTPLARVKPQAGLIPHSAPSAPSACPSPSRRKPAPSSIK